MKYSRDRLFVFLCSMTHWFYHHRACLKKKGLGFLTSTTDIFVHIGGLLLTGAVLCFALPLYWWYQSKEEKEKRGKH